MWGQLVATLRREFFVSHLQPCKDGPECGFMPIDGSWATLIRDERRFVVNWIFGGASKACVPQIEIRVTFKETDQVGSTEGVRVGLGFIDTRRMVYVVNLTSNFVCL